jgi:hypothetical protein
MSSRRSPLPVRAIERCVLASLHAEAHRTNRPLAILVAEAINAYVVRTDADRVQLLIP